MELLVQPEDGLAPVLRGIDRARTSVEVVIFRSDRSELEKALANAAARGVFVHALVAATNRNGEEKLRDLEMRLLAAGVTVTRTADDLVRYHDKLLIVDRSKLYLLAFNFTSLDIRHSRSFAVVTRNRKLVQEAARLFEADVRRQPYAAGAPEFVVSPVNARRQLAALIRKAKKELLIYDPNVSDPAMIRLLEERAAAGVDVRIIGRLARKRPGIAVHSMAGPRLHTRTIVRDGQEVFIGSQSLRALELDARRETGLIFRDPKAVRRLREIFAADWDRGGSSKERAEDEDIPAGKVARRVAKVLARDLPAVAPVLDVVVKEVVGGKPDVKLDSQQIEETVTAAVKDAVQNAVKDVVEDAVEQSEDK